MKQTVLIALFITSLNCSAQNIIIDSCGVDNSSTITQYEADYFNTAFKNHAHAVDFNFEGKKILFTTGNYGSAETSKSEFFNSSAKPRFENDDFPSLEIITLTEAEKIEFDNHDAIVVTWSKIAMSERNRKKFIQNARRKDT